MTKPKLKVIHLEEDPEVEHKYIIGDSPDGENLVYVAGINTGQIHADIYFDAEEENHIKRALGGGIVTIESPQMILESLSTNFGTIPKQILEYYALEILSAYQKIWSELTKIISNPDNPLWDPDKSLDEFLKDWQPFTDRLGINLKDNT